MKKLHLILLLAGAFARQATAAPAADLTLRVAPERDVVFNGGSREVVVQIDLDARRPEHGKRSPMNLALVLDRSGSMQGAKIEKARQAACVAVDHLGDDDYLSLVTFDNDTDVLLPPERVGGQRHREELKSRIERIRPGGGTAIHAGVSVGAQQVRRYLEKEFVNRIILMSDGLANVGPSRTSDLSALGRDLRRDGLSVTTVGLGDDYNEDLMTALAEASNANYYYVRDAEKLPCIFAEELGAARSLVARGVTLHIRVPAGVRLKEIIGQPDIQCRERSASITLPEYFGGDKRRFLARCVVEEKNTAPLEVAAVDLKYEAAGGGTAEPQQQAAKVNFTDEQKKSDATVCVEVAKEVSVVENRLDKERAVQLSDQGNAQEAARVLRNRAGANAAAPAAVQVPNWQAENKKLEQAASEVESQGRLGSSSRKGIQYENWQDKYQKR
ncbi:MAG: VWA domain-containing protein [Chthoniobacter sp.]|nr:VWA domain-containing protein [Chthoniobacter sp.]